MKEAADVLTRLERLPQALRARLLKSRVTLPHSWRARDTIPRGFEGPPFILRLYGHGEVLEPDNPNFDELNKRFALDLGVRSIIRMRLTRIQDSCGYGVPLYDFVKPRDTLLKWAKKKGEQGIVKFKREYNV